MSIGILHSGPSEAIITEAERELRDVHGGERTGTLYHYSGHLHFTAKIYLEPFTGSVCHLITTGVPLVLAPLFSIQAIEDNILGYVQGKEFVERLEFVWRESP